MVSDTKVLTDIKVDSPLNEYLSVKGIDFTFLPKIQEDIPLVDMISEKVKGKNNTILVLEITKGIDSLFRLYKQKSRYNNFEKLVENLTLVLYHHGDCLLNLDLAFEQSRDFANWINYLRPYVLCGGRPGNFFKKNYDGCQFVSLPSYWLGEYRVQPHLHGFKKHQPDKDFLCLMVNWSTRPHRRLLNEQMISKGLVKNTIYKFKERNNETHEDLKQSYPEIYIKGNSWLDAIPPVHYYNRTNLELSVETFTRNNFDDSFYLTEKTTKPIMMKHPFMILSNFHHLKNLRELGFRTFGDYLDESYDLEPDVNKRIAIIIKNLEELRTKSKKFYDQTKEITEHNHLNLQHQAGMWKTLFWNVLDDFFKNV